VNNLLTVARKLRPNLQWNEEEKERLQWEGFAEKEGFKPRMKVSG